jgi:hypothetical protein
MLLISAQTRNFHVLAALVLGRTFIGRGEMSRVYGLTPLGSRPPRPRGSVCNFGATGLPSQIA